MSAPVSTLARGRARDLIRRLGEADRAYTMAAGRLLEITHAEQFPTRPKRIEQALRRLGKQWEHELPGFGRLRHHVTQHGIERINLGDLRCTATELRRAEWTDSEPGIAVALRSIIVAPGAPIVDSRWIVATIGLHAVARRIERAAYSINGRHDDEAILDDVLDVVIAWPKHLAGNHVLQLSV